MDYEKIYLSRFKVLKIAFDNAREQGLTETGDYQKFLTENAYWLDDYALYMAVKNSFWRCLLYGMGRGHPSQKSSGTSQIP